MSIYSLSTGTASGIGPVFGGFLNDNLGPRFIWMGAFLSGMISASWFGILSKKEQNPVQAVAVESQ
jgi:MFS family permease